MSPPELKIFTEDLLDGAPGVPDCSVDMIFTSPPYKKKDGLSVELMKVLGQVAGRVLRPGGRMFMIFGQLRPEGFDRPYEARRLVQERSQLVPGQTICWVKSAVVLSWRELVLEEIATKPWEGGGYALIERIKAILRGAGKRVQRGHYTPIVLKSPTLNYGWEPIFTFYKPPEPALDRLSIGVGFTDKSNMRRGARGKHGDLHCAGDVWMIPYKTTGAKKKKATATMGNAYSFPVELPLRAIKLCGLKPGSVVFDPFAGSGTTLVAARQLGMHAWAIEIDPESVPVIEQRWEEVGDGRIESK